MKKTYLRDDLIFASEKVVKEWVGHRVRLTFNNNEEHIEGIIKKFLYDDDSYRTITDPQYQPVGLNISGQQINFGTVKNMEILDI